MHGHIYVNERKVRGYNYRVHFMDYVNYDPSLYYNFYLYRLFERFFFFKLFRSRTKSRTLMLYFHRKNMFGDTRRNSFQLIYNNYQDIFGNFKQKEFILNSYLFYFFRGGRCKNFVVNHLQQCYGRGLYLNRLKNSAKQSRFRKYYKFNRLVKSLMATRFSLLRTSRMQLKKNVQRQLLVRFMLLVQRFSYVDL